MYLLERFCPTMEKLFVWMRPVECIATVGLVFIAGIVDRIFGYIKISSNTGICFTIVLGRSIRTVIFVIVEFDEINGLFLVKMNGGYDIAKHTELLAECLTIFANIHGNDTVNIIG